MHNVVIFKAGFKYSNYCFKALGYVVA